MRTLNRSGQTTPPERRGVALLMALLLLVVLIAITIQISATTGTDARIARNDLNIATMDLSIESALLQVGETLKTDGESAQDGGGGATPGAGAAGAGAGAGAAGAGGAGAAGAGQSQASDSRRDEWCQAQRTTINDVDLRIFVQDEDSKYNVLNMLAPDEKEARAAYDRVVRILDGCREGSREFDIDPRMADDMAKAMLEHMQRRKDSKVPRPKQLTDDESSDVGLPLTLEEFAALKPFEEHHFRDFRDRDGQVVHSIGSFLTVWTSLGLAADLPPTTAGGANRPAGTPTGGTGTGAASTGGNASTRSGSSTGTGSTSGSKSGSSTSDGTSGGTSGTGGTNSGGTGSSGSGTGTGTGTASGGASGASGGTTTTGGYGVNVNTAPAAVLKGLFDGRDLYPRFFDRVIEYRNLEEEEDESAKSNTDTNAEKEPELDEYGQEKIQRRIFDSLGELSEVEGYTDLPAEQQARLNQLLTTTSNVFSIYVVARKTTAIETDADVGLTPAELRKREEMSGDALVRVVRCVVWRHTVDDEIVLTPIVRWEILDYLPYEVLDFPPDDR